RLTQELVRSETDLSEEVLNCSDGRQAFPLPAGIGDGTSRFHRPVLDGRERGRLSSRPLDEGRIVHGQGFLQGQQGTGRELRGDGFTKYLLPSNHDSSPQSGVRKERVRCLFSVRSESSRAQAEDLFGRLDGLGVLTVAVPQVTQTLALGPVVGEPDV